MDKLMPSANIKNNNGNGKGKLSFLRRLALGFVILIVLGLLYVPAYHSAQGPLLGLGETSPPNFPVSLDSSHYVASVDTPISAELAGWTYNTSRDLCVYIHPENTTTVLSPVSICTPSPYLLIVICSAVTNRKTRIAIRNTWANKHHLDTLYNSTVRIVFLLGQSDNDTLNNSILDESLRYNDIIQEQFHDTYNNLTLKSVMMLKWVTTKCEYAKYLMKTDDDMFVNIPTLLKTLKSKVQSTDTLFGSLICNARPISDPKNKWYTPKYMYSKKTYPNYLSGTGYVMSLDVATKLYETSLATPLLHLEDVYLTGVCAQRAKLHPMNHPAFSYAPRKLDPCIFKSVITAHKVSTSNLYTIWSKLNDLNVSCSNIHPYSNAKSVSLNRNGRNAGYYIARRRNTNRCV